MGTDFSRCLVPGAKVYHIVDWGALDASTELASVVTFCSREYSVPIDRLRLISPRSTPKLCKRCLRRRGAKRV